MVTSVILWAVEDMAPYGTMQVYNSSLGGIMLAELKCLVEKPVFNKAIWSNLRERRVECDQAPRRPEVG